jgi:7-cyano-7-deazaguanine synthase
MSRDSVVLLSGGLDSSVLLYKMAQEGKVYPITINYGQRHQKEITAARNICEALSREALQRWKMLDLSSDLKGILPSTLTGVGAIPEGHYEDESMKATVVPNRNMILLAIAAGYATGLGIKQVAYAAHSGDHAIYPDCRPVFIRALTEAIRLGTGWGDTDGVRLVAPFQFLSKAQVVGQGVGLQVPFSRTWSCYKGSEYHCGVCGTCRERIEAFQVAHVKDPTVYEKGRSEA